MEHTDSFDQLIETNTIGTPVGIVASSYTMSTADIDVSELQPQRFATILHALAKVYLIPETAWTPEAIDEVLQEGQKTYVDSQAVPNDNGVLSPIYNIYENRIKRTLYYDEVVIEIELNSKFSPTTRVDFDFERQMDDMLVEQLPATMQAFFEKGRNYCLLMLDDWYLMIWRAWGAYFVFDFYGRGKIDLVSDRVNGAAMLICVRHLENIIHLIMNLSNIKTSTTFNIRQMRVVRITSPDGKSAVREFKKRKNEFTIINPDYAVLTANLHLSLNPIDPIRNASAITTAIVALIASKIDHPSTWISKHLDRLICCGVNLFRFRFMTSLYDKDKLQLDQFPRMMKMGQYAVQLWLEPRISTGVWRCVPNYRQSKLSTVIQESFDAGHNKLVLQIENQGYSIWEKNGFIYLFDPFRHRIQGDIFPQNINEKFASLRMFRSMDLFLGVLNQILMESTTTNSFYIHSLHINRIELKAKTGHNALTQNEFGDGVEVTSLNENICFEVDEIRCYIDLGAVSDYGNDDQELPPEEIEPKSESDEPEEMEHEEEGIGEAGEAEISSGDED